MNSEITFSEYQEEAKKTAVSPDIEVVLERTWEGDPVRTAQVDWVYPAIGLADEAGEVLGKLKKVIRDQDGHILGSQLNSLASEIGDVLWYLSELSSQLGLSLGNIASNNLSKLADRQERGVIQGSGDNR